MRGVYITPIRKNTRTVHKKVKSIKCEMCGTRILSPTARQRYCGSWRRKSGCSFKARTDGQKEWRKNCGDYFTKKERLKRSLTK